MERGFFPLKFSSIDEMLDDNEEKTNSNLELLILSQLIIHKF